jgi:hypothetical protein
MKRLIIPVLIFSLIPLLIACNRGSNGEGGRQIRGWRSRHTVPAQQNQNR